MNVTATRRAGPSLGISLAVLILGLVVAVPSTIVIAVRTVRALSSPSMTTPGVANRHLTPGTWLIFERTGTKTGIGGFTITHINAPTIGPQDVTVTGPDGDSPVSPVTVLETITEGPRVYTAALQFTAPSAGTYAIQVDTPGSEVIIERPLEQTFRGEAKFGLGILAGGLLVLIGGVLLIVGSVRRGRARTVASSRHAWAGSTPAGWYPDPSRAGGTRWWDGTRWTDHWG